MKGSARRRQPCAAARRRRFGSRRRPTPWSDRSPLGRGRSSRPRPHGRCLRYRRRQAGPSRSTRRPEGHHAERLKSSFTGVPRPRPGRSKDTPSKLLHRVHVHHRTLTTPRGRAVETRPIATARRRAPRPGNVHHSATSPLGLLPPLRQANRPGCCDQTRQEAFGMVRRMQRNPVDVAPISRHGRRERTRGIDERTHENVLSRVRSRLSRVRLTREVPQFRLRPGSIPPTPDCRMNPSTLDGTADIGYKSYDWTIRISESGAA